MQSVIDGDEDEMDNMIPTTAYGQNTLTVDVKGQYISRYVILNNCGRLLAHQHRKLRGTTMQRNFLEEIIANTAGYTVPLLYPETMLFTRLF